MEKSSKNKKRKRKNGIWFNDTTAIENFSEASAEKLQQTLENIIFYGITIPIQLIQTVGVFAIAIYNDAFAELSFFLVGFFFTRTFLGETYHLNSTIMCTTFTWISFFIITSLIPSVYVSVFLCIILGCLMSAYMHYVVVKEEKICREE